MNYHRPDGVLLEVLTENTTRVRLPVGERLARSEAGRVGATGYQWRSVDLRDYSATDMLLFDCEFIDCCFDDVTFHGAEVYQCTFDRSRMQRVEMRKALFPGCSLIECDWSDARCVKTEFYNADLKSAIFANAYLLESSFLAADLREVDFSEADLSSVGFIDADMTGTILDGATLTGCRLGLQTRFVPASMRGIKAVYIWIGDQKIEGQAAVEAALEALIERSKLLPPGPVRPPAKDEDEIAPGGDAAAQPGNPGSAASGTDK